MTAVGRADRSQRAPAASQPGESLVEKRRAELKKQLAELGSGWSDKKAQKREALNAQLAALAARTGNKGAPKTAAAAPARPPLGPTLPPQPRGLSKPQRLNLNALPTSAAAGLDLSGRASPGRLSSMLASVAPPARPAPPAGMDDPLKALSGLPKRVAPSSGPPMRNTLFLGPDFREAMASKDVQRADSGLVSPEKGKVYTTNVDWEGKQHEISATFDEKLITQLKSTGARVDIANGELVARDGKRTSLLPSAAGSYASETGQPAPRSLVRLSDADPTLNGAPPEVLNSYALPTHIHYLRDAAGAGAAALTYDSQYPTIPIPKGPLTPTTAASAGQVEPVAEPPGGFVKKQLAPGVSIEGVSEESIQRVMPAINEILGKSLKDPRMFGSSEDLEKLQGMEGELRQAAMGELVRRESMPVPPGITIPDAARTRELIGQAQALTARDDGSTWTAMDAYGAVRAREAELGRQQAETRIVVVPKGKHWSAMPQFEHVEEDEPTRRLMSGAVTDVRTIDEGDKSRTRVTVAFPEDNIGNAEHELFHLLDDRFMTNDQHARLDAAYQSAVEKKGAFARMYGAVPHEYWTTWSEAFRGDSGPQGVQFLKKNAPDMYKLLSEVTGQNP